MRKSLTLLIVSLFIVVLAMPAFAQDTTGGSPEPTSEPVLQAVLAP